MTPRTTPRTTRRTTPGPAPQNDEPPTPAEIAEGRRLADEHLAVVCRGLAGLPKAPRRRHLRKRPASGANDWTQGQRLLANAVWLLAVHCRRGDCRRRSACCHGARPGEVTRDGCDRPCLERLPKAARLALPFALLRRMHPAGFRDPDLCRREDEALRTARGVRADAGK